MAGKCRKKEDGMNNDDNEKCDEKITSFIAELVRKGTDFLKEDNYLCPVCGTELKLQAGGYKRGETKMLGVVVECSECDVTMALDFGVDE